MSSPFVMVFAAGMPIIIMETPKLGKTKQRQTVIGQDEVNHQIARQFAPNHPIALLCPPSHNLKAAVSAAHDAGGEAVLFETDLSSVESIKASVASASAQFGKQCAAAIFQVRAAPAAADAPFLEQPTAEFRAATTTQVASAYAFSQAVMPLLTYGGGHAEFPATLAFVGCAGASRSDKIVENALVALSRSLGREYGKKYIHVAHVKFNKGAVAERSKTPNVMGADGGARVAETLWHLYTQPLNCFANELVI
ncbi:hypothetical protein MY3296_006630 [Beauveria thailandica]